MYSSFKKKRTLLDINCDTFMISFQVLQSEQFPEKFRVLQLDVKMPFFWSVSHKIVLAFKTVRVMSGKAARCKDVSKI